MKILALNIAFFAVLFFLSRRLDHSSYWVGKLRKQMRDVYDKEEVITLISDVVHTYKEWYLLIGAVAGSAVTWFLMRR